MFNYMVRTTETLVFTGVGEAEPAFVEEKFLVVLTAGSHLY